MARSYNGYPVGTARALGIQSYLVPGTKVHMALLPAAAPVLLWIGHQIDLRVADIDVTKGHREPDDWGHAYRKTRGATSWSNHASGTAGDYNATSWPRGVSRMTPAQIRECRQIRDEINEAAGKTIIDWGGDYKHSPLDQMHWELAHGATAADVRRAVAKLTGGRKHPPTLWKSRRPAKPHYTRMLQKALHITVDGDFGRETRRAVIKYRREHKLGRPLAVAGPRVWKSLKLWELP